ncbi:hypothetical protein C8J56DRAFT_20299 [Mycena floridula]|nr:hypothetical protein C8J56DRAFT_20299 [Mycena floridula]
MPRAFSIDFSAVKTVPLGAPLLAEYPVVSFSNPIYEPPAKLPDNIKLESIIHLGDHTSVYHASGNFAFPSGQSEPVQLVVKFAPLRTLEMESSAYDILDEGSLTGKVTPVFLGMLLAAVPNNRGSLGCIITELWGSSLTTDFYELAKADKATILDKLVALHEIGILHLDFEPQNVLQLGGDFRIIDFGRVDLNHQCSPRRTRYNFSEAGEYLLEGGRDYLCNSVWHVALEMRLWERGTESVDLMQS